MKKKHQLIGTKNPVGAQPTISKEVTEKICADLRMLMSYRGAATRHGVGETTFWEWMRRGGVESGGIYQEFRKSVLKAVSDGEAIALGSGEKHAIENKSETWYRWKLESRFPKDYAKQVRVYIEQEMDTALERLEEAFANAPKRINRELALDIAFLAIAGDEGASKVLHAEEGADDETGRDGGEAVLATPSEPETEGLP